MRGWYGGWQWASVTVVAAATKPTRFLQHPRPIDASAIPATMSAGIALANHAERMMFGCGRVARMRAD
jgi:hypothetical protein